jgi:tagatose-1,6-bisphosphate aldolase
MTDRPWWMPDPRGWIGIGVFAMSVMLLWMMKEDPNLRGDEFFQTIATVIITNGLMAVVAWAFAVTKTGGELAEKNAQIVEKATKVVSDAPVDVHVVNPKQDPVNTEAAPVATDTLPDYAR